MMIYKKRSAFLTPLREHTRDENYQSPGANISDNLRQ